MAKQTKPKKDKPAITGTWEDVIKASVSGNPKPKDRAMPNKKAKK